MRYHLSNYLQFPQILSDGIYIKKSIFLKNAIVQIFDKHASIFIAKF